MLKIDMYKPFPSTVPKCHLTSFISIDIDVILLASSLQAALSMVPPMQGQYRLLKSANSRQSCPYTTVGTYYYVLVMLDLPRFASLCSNETVLRRVKEDEIPTCGTNVYKVEFECIYICP